MDSNGINGDYFQKRSYEVFFPGEFTFDQPWGDDDFRIDVPNECSVIKQPDYCVEVKRVAHITHFESAKNIISSGFKFQAKQKTGAKGYSYICQTADRGVSCDLGKFIPIDKSTFIPCPGYFSWWAIEITNYPHSKDFDKKCRDLNVKSILSSLFTPDSMYGTVKLSLDFQSLCSSYVESIAPGQQEHLLFKVGGTLRYKKEVCYVIVVCVAKDGVDPLPDFPNLDDLSNLRIRQPISYFSGGPIPQGGVGVSWDHYVFALYYPNDHPTKTLTLDPFVVTITGVEHYKYRDDGSYYEPRTPGLCHLVNRNRDLHVCPDYNMYRNTPIPLEDNHILISYFWGGPIPKGGVGVSWDHYVFALYYPNDHPTKTLTLDPIVVTITGVQHYKYRDDGSYYEPRRPGLCHLVNRNFHIKICPDYEKFKENPITLRELQEIQKKQIK